MPERSLRDLDPRELVWNARATLGLVFVVAVVYGLQLLAAGSLKPTAAYRVANGWLRSEAWRYLLLSPLFHSSHDHFVQNLLSFFVSGAIAERRVGAWPLVLFVYVVGVASNVLPGVFGYGGLGVGISGAFYGLWAFVGVRYTMAWWDQLDAGKYKRFLKYLAISFLGLAYVATSLLQYVGMLSVSSGTAAGAHLTGVVLGVVWEWARPILPRTIQAWNSVRV